MLAAFGLKMRCARGDDQHATVRASSVLSVGRLGFGVALDFASVSKRHPVTSHHGYRNARIYKTSLRPPLNTKPNSIC